MKLRFAFLFALAFASSARAILWIVPSRFSAPSSGGGGGGGSPALIASVGVVGGPSGGTTAAIDTTGANLLIVSVAFYTTSGTLTDSKGNTWTPMTIQTMGSNSSVRLYYCYGGTVGSGHTFTVDHNYSCHQVLAFSNVASSPFDVQNGRVNNTSWTSSMTSGSVTPSQANTIIVAGLCADNGSGTLSISDSMTITNSYAYSAGVNLGGAIAYKILTSASAINPTWSTSASYNDGAAAVATFKY